MQREVHVHACTNRRSPTGTRSHMRTAGMAFPWSTRRHAWRSCPTDTCVHARTWGFPVLRCGPRYEWRLRPTGIRFRTPTPDTRTGRYKQRPTSSTRSMAVLRCGPLAGSLDDRNWRRSGTSVRPRMGRTSTGSWWDPHNSSPARLFVVRRTSRTRSFPHRSTRRTLISLDWIAGSWCGRLQQRSGFPRRLVTTNAKETALCKSVCINYQRRCCSLIFFLFTIKNIYLFDFHVYALLSNPVRKNEKSIFIVYLIENYITKFIVLSTFNHIHMGHNNWKLWCWTHYLSTNRRILKFV